MPNEEKRKERETDSFIDNLRAAAKAMEDIVEERDDVKDGKVSKEEILNSKAFMLFSAILNTSEQTFMKEDVQKMIVTIGESIGEKASQSLVQLLILLISTIVYDAIGFYDEQLKGEIDANFGSLINNVNFNHADIKAQEGAINVFRKKLDLFEKALITADILKDVEESTEEKEEG